VAVDLFIVSDTSLREGNDARARSRNRRRRLNQLKEGLDLERFAQMGVKTGLLGLGHIPRLRVAG
jgi:hypothetical protein